MRTISLALTHFNRFDFLLEAISRVHTDPRIGEIVISDDCSTDGSYSELIRHFLENRRVKVYQNDKNLDCYANKKAVVERAANEWVILFDSDNLLPASYLDAIYSIDSWDPQTAYCPTYAEPHFDYRAFAGVTVDRSNVQTYLKHPSFLTALNTANYFVNRAEYLRVWDGSVNPHTADSLFMNYNWLKHCYRLHFVPGMQYQHRVHAMSHYKLNVHKTGDLAKQIENKLRELK